MADTVIRAPAPAITWEGIKRVYPDPKDQLKVLFFFKVMGDEARVNQWTKPEYYARVMAYAREHYERAEQGTFSIVRYTNEFSADAVGATLRDALMGARAYFGQTLAQRVAGDDPKNAYIEPLFNWGFDLATGRALSIEAQLLRKRNQQELRRALEPQAVAIVDELGGACRKFAGCEEQFKEEFPELFEDNGGFVGDGGFGAVTPGDVISADRDRFPAPVVAGVRADGTVRFNPSAARREIEAQLGALSGSLLSDEGTFGISLDLAHGVADLELSLLDTFKEPPRDELEEKRNRIEAAKEDAKALVEAARATVGAIAAIAGLFDEDLGEDVKKAGDAVVDTAEAAVSLAVATAEFAIAFGTVNPVGIAKGAMDVVSSMASLVGVFTPKDEKPKPEQKVLDAVNEVRKAVIKLHDQMEQRFNRIDKALTLIYSTTVDQLNAIRLDTAQIVVDVAAVQETLQAQTLSIRRLEDELRFIAETQNRKPLRDAVEIGVGWSRGHTQPMPAERFVDFQETFHSYAVEHASNATETGAESRDFGDRALARELTWPLHENVHYVDQYVGLRNWPRFAQTPTGERPLPNPYTWSVAASSYAQLLHDWPEHAGLLTTAWSDDVALGGTRLNEAFNRIAKSDELFPALYKNHHDKAAALGAELQAASVAWLHEKAHKDLPGSIDAPFDWWGPGSEPVPYEPPLTEVQPESGTGAALPAPDGLVAWATGVERLCVTHDWLAPADARALKVTYVARLTAEAVEMPRTGDIAWQLTCRLTLTARFGATVLVRVEGVTGVKKWFTSKPSTSNPAAVLAETWPSARAKFLDKAEEVPLTGRELQALEQLQTELPDINQRLMHAFLGAHRGALFKDLAIAVADPNPPPQNTIAAAAIELTGSKRLLDAVISLGFGRAREVDDELRALLDGAPPADGGAALLDQYGVQRALEANVPGYLDNKPPARETVGAWLERAAADPLALLEKVVTEIQADIAADRHREFAPVVQRSLVRLAIAELVAHPPDTVGGIVSQLPILKRGSRGAAVRRAQGLLRAKFPKLDDTTLKLNGTYGPATEKLVKDAQKKAGVAVTGVVDEATWRALLGVPQDKSA
jgi:Putative peptidoglycan binding domain